MADIPIRPAPPALFTRLLNWSLPKPLKEVIVGDLWEEHFQKSNSQGVLGANIWYCQQALKTSWRFMLKSKKGLLMFVLAVLVFFVMIMLAMLFGGELGMFFDKISLVIVLVPAWLLAVSTTSFRHFSEGLQLLFDDDKQVSQLDLTLCIKTYVTLGNTSLILGGLMTLLAWVAIGSNLDDLSALGPAFAVSILTLMYSMIVKALCYTIEQNLQTRLLIMQVGG